MNLIETVSIREALAAGTALLARCSDSARLDAELLLAHAIDVPRSYLFAHPEDRLDDDAEARFRGAIERRRAGEPMAYITGYKEFWSLGLLVSPATLVPRPETELLVELALRDIPRNTALRILDLGTGCGAIAVALGRERPMCDVTAIDNSAAAIAITRQNVRQLGLANVRCLEGNWTEPVRAEQFDVIVSNPPYIAERDPALEHLAAEPAEALLAGEDGLSAIRILARDCGRLLLAEGKLFMEHGADQDSAVASILAQCDWVDIHCHADFAGRPRVTTARYKV